MNTVSHWSSANHHHPPDTSPRVQRRHLDVSSSVAVYVVSEEGGSEGWIIKPFEVNLWSGRLYKNHSTAWSGAFSQQSAALRLLWEEQCGFFGFFVRISADLASAQREKVLTGNKRCIFPPSSLFWIPQWLSTSVILTPLLWDCDSENVIILVGNN